MCRPAVTRRSPHRRVANEMRRDTSQLRQNDNFAVLFDTFLDRRNGFEFTLNSIAGGPSGCADCQRAAVDWRLEHVWGETAAPGTFEGGWAVEVAIPFKSLRYRPGGRIRCGASMPCAPGSVEQRAVACDAHAQGARDEGGSGTMRRWRPRSSGSGGAGRLEGNLEIKPYVISNARQHPHRAVTAMATEITGRFRRGRQVWEGSPRISPPI